MFIGSKQREYNLPLVMSSGSFSLLSLRVELSLAVSITHLDELVTRCFDPVLGALSVSNLYTGVPSLRALGFSTRA